MIIIGCDFHIRADVALSSLRLLRSFTRAMSSPLATNFSLDHRDARLPHSQNGNGFAAELCTHTQVLENFRIACYRRS
jgi:hypothetical protein